VFLLAGLGTAAVGVLFGLPSLRIKGFYLAVATLASQFFLVWMFNKVPGGQLQPSGVITRRRARSCGDCRSPAPGHPIRSTCSCWSFVVFLALVAKNLVRSRIGRSWMAIRDMDIAAEIIGIRPLFWAKLSRSRQSFYIGIAGALWAFVYTGLGGGLAFEISAPSRCCS
jgi:branched-chain amino acid transport system permease protein